MKNNKETLNHNVFRITSDSIDTHLARPIITIEDIFNWVWHDIMVEIYSSVGVFTDLWDTGRKGWWEWRQNEKYVLLNHPIKPSADYDWYASHYIWYKQECIWYMPYSPKRART